MEEDIVVNVSLLLPPQVEQLVMHENELLRQKYEPRIVLDKNPCFPHLTLCMCVIDKQELDEISAALEEVVAEIIPIDVRFVDTYSQGSMEDLGFCGLEVQKGEGIVHLHQQVVALMKQHAGSREPSNDMFANDMDPADTTGSFVQRYIEEFSGEDYYPHVTMGFGEPRELAKPIHFVASSVAICHMGSYGTAQKILAQVDA